MELWQKAKEEDFQFLLGCYHPLFFYGWETWDFQFLLGCYVNTVALTFSHFEDFQFLLGCYRFKRAATSRLTVLGFQFLLGCYRLARVQTRWEQVLSIPFRMLHDLHDVAWRVGHLAFNSF